MSFKVFHSDEKILNSEREKKVPYKEIEVDGKLYLALY